MRRNQEGTGADIQMKVAVHLQLERRNLVTEGGIEVQNQAHVLHRDITVQGTTEGTQNETSPPLQRTQATCLPVSGHDIMTPVLAAAQRKIVSWSSPTSTVGEREGHLIQKMYSDWLSFQISFFGETLTEAFVIVLFL